MKKIFEKAAEHFTPLRIGLVLFGFIAILFDHVAGFAGAYTIAMALTADRDTPEREAKLFYYKIAAGKKCFAGGIAVRNSTGYAQPGTTATGLVSLGRLEDYVDNTAGGDGDLSVTVREGTFRWKNSAVADLITIADLGEACYIVDDETVAKTSGGNTRSIAGIIRDVDDDGVFVEMGNNKSLAAGLVAANNLSDVANAGTARSNIGANKVPLSLCATSLVGATVYGIVSPVAGTISKIHTVLKGAALTTGNAILTGKIGGVAITDGVVTITQAGSAIGDKDSATPSALNVVAVGDEIQFLVGGTNDAAAAFAEVSVLILT